MDFNALVKAWSKGEEIRATPEQRRFIALAATGHATDAACEAAGRDFAFGVKTATLLPRFLSAGGRAAVEKEEDNTLSWIISTDKADRSGDVINQSGWNFRNYRNNPIVLWGHGASWMGKVGLDADEPIGVGFKFRKEKIGDATATVMSIRFAVEESERAARKYRLAKSGVINAGSVGFIPEKIVSAQTDEEREKYGLGKYGVYFEKQELLEFSLCAIPCHQDALRLALMSNAITEEDARFASAMSDPTEKEWERLARERAHSRISLAGIQVPPPPEPAADSGAELVATLRAVAETQRNLATALTDFVTHSRELRPAASGPSSGTGPSAGGVDMEKLLAGIKTKKG